MVNEAVLLFFKSFFPRLCVSIFELPFLNWTVRYSIFLPYSTDFMTSPPA